ncbi:MAG: type 1 glutamine amidotransferase [Rhodococcus sp. (in: high G+C Gram-positive bacteria)]
MNDERRAVVLVHDRDPELGFRNIGTLGPELLARGYELDVHSFDYGMGTDAPSLEGADMLVVMGSPAAVYDDLPWIGPEADYLAQAVGMDVPVLGVCFGGQLLAQVLGGTVRKSDRPEHGMTHIVSDRPESVAPGPWMEFHGDTFLAPASATVVARNDAGQQAFAAGQHLGLQFHPEIDVDVFSSWADAWARDGVEHDPVLVDAIRRDVAANEDAARERCALLLDAWIGTRNTVARTA